ncbi:hypothetical protein DNTS_001218 [Danionella cerebrum]|uniref:C2H2-type domain-containing protein n=1 Tax=Danionella cerebrum TaxID=2873325 RepID=A0A553Q443_9TELE|nr:hypothetical protein DNTS_001218 [Danionella translucida]
MLDVSLDVHDGFQTQFTHLMETVLQSAVRETTKLYESTLRCLKSELVQLRLDNANWKRDKARLVDRGCSPVRDLTQHLHTEEIQSETIGDLGASDDEKGLLASLTIIKQEVFLSKPPFKRWNEAPTRKPKLTHASQFKEPSPSPPHSLKTRGLEHKAIPSGHVPVTPTTSSQIRDRPQVFSSKKIQKHPVAANQSFQFSSVNPTGPSKAVLPSYPSTMVLLSSPQLPANSIPRPSPQTSFSRSLQPPRPNQFSSSDQFPPDDVPCLPASTDYLIPFEGAQKQEDMHQFHAQRGQPMLTQNKLQAAALRQVPAPQASVSVVKNFAGENCKVETRRNDEILVDVSAPTLRSRLRRPRTVCAEPKPTDQTSLSQKELNKKASSSNSRRGSQVRVNLSAHVCALSEVNPFSCTLCGKSFKQRLSLKMHVKRHSGVKQYKCPHCEKSFMDAGNFKRHKRIHTGERPFECRQCGKRFIQSGHLKKHTSTQHVATKKGRI